MNSWRTHLCLIQHNNILSILLFIPYHNQNQYYILPLHRRVDLSRSVLSNSKTMLNQCFYQICFSLLTINTMFDIEIKIFLQWILIRSIVWYFHFMFPVSKFDRRWIQHIECALSNNKITSFSFERGTSHFFRTRMMSHHDWSMKYNFRI